MRHASLLVVGIVLICIACVAAIGFVMVSHGVLGFCGPATFCKSETFCMCPEYYAPVLGLPTFKVYSNACFACLDGTWMWIRIQQEARQRFDEKTDTKTLDEVIK